MFSVGRPRPQIAYFLWFCYAMRHAMALSKNKVQHPWLCLGKPIHSIRPFSSLSVHCMYGAWFSILPGWGWMHCFLRWPSWELKAIITVRYAEVKRKVSSLATSGVTALAMLALIPVDVTSRVLGIRISILLGSDLQWMQQEGWAQVPVWTSLQATQNNECAVHKQVKQICYVCVARALM